MFKAKYCGVVVETALLNSWSLQFTQNDNVHSSLEFSGRQIYANLQWIHLTQGRPSFFTTAYILV